VTRAGEPARIDDRAQRPYRIVCPCGRGELVVGIALAAALVRSHIAECADRRAVYAEPRYDSSRPTPARRAPVTSGRRGRT
jgi:hypothetical protein